MGELGLVARLRRRLSLKRKMKGESFTSNGIVTKTLPKRSEGNKTYLLVVMKMLMSQYQKYLKVEELAKSM